MASGDASVYQNLSAVLHGTRNLKFESTPTRAPVEDDVLIRLLCCGICGTDMHAYTQGLDERYVTLPVVLGHEASGEVVQCGSAVTKLKPGDRVAVELGLPCRKCPLCKEGKYNLCKPWSFGGLQRYLTYAADFCHPLPDTLTNEEGALMEPLAVGVRAVKRAGVTIGARVLICAAGAIGLSVLLAAQCKGATNICVTDVSMYRLELAKRMGATTTYAVDPKLSPQAAANEVIRLMGVRPTHVIECSGAPSSLEMAVYAVNQGGVITPVGLNPPDVSLPMGVVTVKEVDIKGSFSYCNDYPAAIALLSSLRVSAQPMITHRLPMSQLTDAIKLLESGKDGVLKVMIDCQK